MLREKGKMALPRFRVDASSTRSRLEGIKGVVLTQILSIVNGLIFSGMNVKPFSLIRDIF